MKPNTGSATTPQCDTLGYAEFYGSFESRFELPNFSIAVVAPDDIWLNGKTHGHESSHIVFVLDDDYVISKGPTDEIVPPGTLMYVPAGTVHRNRPASPKTRILTISISEEFVQGAASYAKLPQEEQSLRMPAPTALAHRLYHECSAWNHGSPLTGAGLCLEIMGAYAVGNESSVRPPRWLVQARDAIDNSFAESHTVNSLARIVGVHPIHFSRTFRTFFRCSCAEYLNSVRLAHAQRMLREEPHSIGQVAQEVGFCDQSYFSRCFKEQMGLTPAQYRDAIP